MTSTPAATAEGDRDDILRHAPSAGSLGRTERGQFVDEVRGLTRTGLWFLFQASQDDPFEGRRKFRAKRSGRFRGFPQDARASCGNVVSPRKGRVPHDIS